MGTLARISTVGPGGTSGSFGLRAFWGKPETEASHWPLLTSHSVPRMGVAKGFDPKDSPHANECKFAPTTVQPLLQMNCVCTNHREGASH